MKCIKNFIKNFNSKISQIEYSYFKKCREKMTFKTLSTQCLKTSWLAFLLFVALIISIVVIIIMACC